MEPPGAPWRFQLQLQRLQYRQYARLALSIAVQTTTTLHHLLAYSTLRNSRQVLKAKEATPCFRKSLDHLQGRHVENQVEWRVLRVNPLEAAVAYLLSTRHHQFSATPHTAQQVVLAVDHRAPSHAQ